MSKRLLCAMCSVALSWVACPAEVSSIKFDFSKPVKYGFFEQVWRYDGTGRVDKVVCSIKRPYRRKMAFRITDATGQTFQREVPQMSGVWVRHECSVDGRWSLHFGGAKDGEMHHPIRDFRLLVLGGTEHGVSGEVLVKDVEMREEAPRSAPMLKLSAKVDSEVCPSELNLEVAASNSAFEGGKIDVGWTLWDGEVVGRKTVAVPPVASGAVWRATLEYLQPPKGRNAIFCNAVFSHSGRSFDYEGPVWTAPVPTLPVPRCARPELPWGTGIYLHRWGWSEKSFRQMERLAAAAKDAGVSWLREQLAWRYAERNGRVDFSKFDRVMEICESNRLSICMLFGALDKSIKNTDPDYPEIYCEALRKAVRHYRGRVAAWEICNEPNLPWPMDRRWAANYRRLLPMAARVIREEDPAARSVGCSASGLGVGFVGSLSGEAFDDVSIHPYRRFVDDREFLADLAELWKAGRRRDVWITEIGWDSFPGYTRRKNPDHKVSMHEFASLMARSHMVAAAADGVKAVFGYDFVDDGVLAAGYEYHMGVLYSNVTPKPAYRAIAKTFRHFNAGRPRIDVRKDGVRIFGMGGRSAIWTAGAMPCAVAVERKVRATNLMDEEIAGEDRNGRYVYLTDERHPVFFDEDPGEVELAGAGVSDCGEKLYNGIVLPKQWPPKTVDYLDRKPKKVPYLENRPAVVPIDVGRQLFVDDFLIATKKDIVREFHYPEKHQGNPVLKPQTPLEVNRPSNSCARMVGGGIWWDPKIKRFRLWYEAGWLNTVGYAESEDGINFERVALDVVPGTNRVFPQGTPRTDSWVVMPDFKRADPYSRWLFFMRPPGGEAQVSYVAESGDGIHWSRLREAGKCGDRSTAFYNPFRGKWVFSLRAEMGPWGKGGTRSRSYREADDFFEGSKWRFELKGTTDDVVMWLQPDDLDVRDPVLKLKPQIYNFDAVAYESIMLGAFSVWRGPENNEIVKSGMPKIVDVEFAYSRDGFHFDRPDRTPAIAAERWASKKWDAGYVQNIGNILVVKDEKLYFYYSACAGNPDRLGIGGFSCDLNGAYDQGASGVAILRRDGFASMRPAVERKSGEFTTVPVRFSGRYMFVNADMSKGRLKVEVLDEKGLAVPGFAAEDCIPVKLDSTKVQVRWKGEKDLGCVAGRIVRFRFVVEGGDLYSFWVSPSPKGESGGYLGGGGPDYPGVRDVVISQ